MPSLTYIHHTLFIINSFIEWRMINFLSIIIEKFGLLKIPCGLHNFKYHMETIDMGFLVPKFIYGFSTKIFLLQGKTNEDRVFLLWILYIPWTRGKHFSLPYVCFQFPHSPWLSVAVFLISNKSCIQKNWEQSP